MTVCSINFECVNTDLIISLLKSKCFHFWLSSLLPKRKDSRMPRWILPVVYVRVYFRNSQNIFLSITMKAVTFRAPG